MVEFSCNIPSLKSLTEDSKVTAWNSYQLMNLMRGKQGEEMQLIIDHMGELSATAQRLRGPITTVERLLQSFQKLYLFTSNVQGNPGHILAQGILKVGQKNLFIRRHGVQLVEMSPLCVLDFYVHESCQRQGLGHKLFEFMLEQENKRPCHLGYDKPSNKLLSFMAKHYNLRRYESQANQFVVYNDYFGDVENEALGLRENSQKEWNSMPDICTALRKEEVIHSLRAKLQADDAEEPHDLSRPSSRLASARDARASLDVKNTGPPQPSYHRGRKNNWRPKQDNSEKSANPLDSPQNSDVRSSLRSPIKSDLPLRDAYRRGLNEQSKIIQQRKSSSSQSSEPRKWHGSRRAALKPCNNSHEHQPLFSVIGDEERVRIQSLCSPALAQKMNVTHATHCYQDPKPIKPHAHTIPGRLVTKQSTSKEPPPSYPFWSEAKEVASSQHSQERTPVDYRRSRVCC